MVYLYESLHLKWVWLLLIWLAVHACVFMCKNQQHGVSFNFTFALQEKENYCCRPGFRVCGICMCLCRFMQSSIFVCKDKRIVLLDYSSVVKIIWQISPLITWFCLTPPISVKITLHDTKLPPAASLSLLQLSPDRHLDLQPRLYRRNYNNQHLTGLSHAPSWPISWALKLHHHGNIKAVESKSHINCRWTQLRSKGMNYMKMPVRPQLTTWRWLIMFLKLFACHLQ